MPCYNSEDYVDRALLSCINQSFYNWELIVVNDGSTDNTLSIVNRYCSQDERISVYSKENGGYVSAVNYGLDYVKGTYFLFLGSDDELSSTLFADIFDYINGMKNFPDMIGFKTTIHREDGSTLEDQWTDFDYVAMGASANIKTFMDNFPKHSIVLVNRDTSKLYKTEVLDHLRYFGRKGVDADGIFSMCFTHKSSSFLCVPVTGYLWHLREGSVSGRRFDYQTQLDRLKIWIQFGDWLMQMNSDVITKQEVNGLIITFFNVLRELYYEFRSDCKKDGIIELAKSHICRIIRFSGISRLSKELRLFLYHTTVWKVCIIPKMCFERKKKLKII